MVLFSENLTLGKTLANDLIKQVSGTPGIDYALRNCLNKLRDRQERTDNNNLSPLPSPPAVPLGPGPFQLAPNFYNLILAQQDDQTAPVPKRISYHLSFEKYIQNFLSSFSIHDVERFDLYAHRNAKCLFYRFNDYIKMSGGKRQTIKHTLKVKESVGLKKIEERDQQFLVGKISHAVEFKNPYDNSIEKKPEVTTE